MTSKKCKSCDIGAEKITIDELDFMMTSLPDWVIKKENDISKIHRTYLFNNFQKALNFTNRIGALAEDHNHHPSILTEWGKVTVTWWSHGIKDLTLKDLDMAGGCDKLI